MRGGREQVEGAARWRHEQLGGGQRVDGRTRRGTGCPPEIARSHGNSQVGRAAAAK